MALGDVYIFDDAKVEVTTDITSSTVVWLDISLAVGVAKVMLEFSVAEGKHTFGRRGMRRLTSDHYDWNFEVGFALDDFDIAGSLDAIMKTLVRSPYGTAARTSNPGMRIKAAGAVGVGTTGMPSFSGQIVIGDWEPFGSGTVGEPVEFDRTFAGTGNLTRTPVP